MDLDKLVKVANDLEHQLAREHAIVTQAILVEGRGPSVPATVPANQMHHSEYNARAAARQQIKQTAGRLRRFAWHLQRCATMANEIAALMDLGATQ